MAWTAPTTFIAGDPLTVAQLNANASANMKETMVGKATTSGQLFSSNGNNSLMPVTVETTAFNNVTNTTSTSYVNVSGGSVSAVINQRALIFWQGNIMTDSNFNNRSVKLSVALTLGWVLGASDNWCVRQGGNDVRGFGHDFVGCGHFYVGGMAPSTVTFQLKIRMDDLGAGIGEHAVINGGRVSVLPI